MDEERDVWDLDELEPRLPWYERSWNHIRWHFWVAVWFAQNWLVASKWRWRLRKYPKVELTLAHSLDVSFFWPGQVIHAAPGPSSSPEMPTSLSELSIIEGIDGKRGVLRVVQYEAAPDLPYWLGGLRG